MKRTAKKTRPTVRYPRMRAFFSSAMLTACAVMLIAGFLTADYNTRRVGLGSSASMRLDITQHEGQIDIDILGRKQTITLPEQVTIWAGRLYNLLPPEWRVLRWLYESERDAVTQLVTP